MNGRNSIHHFRNGQFRCFRLHVSREHRCRHFLLQKIWLLAFDVSSDRIVEADEVLCILAWVEMLDLAGHVFVGDLKQS